MARRTREEALVTRRQILAAAARIFDQRGLEGTTLLDVAEATVSGLAAEAERVVDGLLVTLGAVVDADEAAAAALAHRAGT